MTKEGAGPQVVTAELDRFIELLFQDSEAYRLALKLYAGRYEVIAGREAADILREVIEKHMPDSDRLSVSEGDETEGRTNE
jgi:rRNA-processing protein FCF1